MTVLTAEEAKKALNGISSRPFQSDVLSAEEAKKALRSVPKSDNREPRTYTVSKPQEPKVYRRNADGLMSEAGTFERAAAPAVSEQKDLLAPLSKPQASAQKDLLAPISRPQAIRDFTTGDVVQTVPKQIDQWNVNAAMPAVKELAGKAVNMGTNILFPLKGMKQGVDLLTGKTQSDFDPEAERQALSQMGAVQRGVERVASGLNSIVETPAAALRYAGETAVQAGKNLAENIGNPEWREAFASGISSRVSPNSGSAVMVWSDELGRYIMVPRGTKPENYTEAWEKWQAENQPKIEARQQAEGRLSALTVDTPVDPNSAGSQMMRQAQDRQAAAVEGLSPAGQFIGNTLASVGQNAMLMPLAAINPAVPLAGMAGMAGAGKAYEVQQAGGGAMEALARGTGAALIEAATEKLPLDDLLKIVSSPAGKEAIWDILELMGTEATEEAVSYVANYIADVAAKDPNAEFSLKDMMLSALGGGLSGGFMGAGGTVVGYARNGNVNSQAAQPTQESAFTRQAGTNANAAPSAAQVDPAGHTPEMQRTIAEYQAAVDSGIVAFVKKVMGMQNRNATSKLNLPLSKVGQDAASKIDRLTGVNVAGYRHNMNGSAVNHITERHGQAGKSDTSMANIEDIARIQYVLDRYDSLAPVLTPEGNPDVTYAYHNSDGSPAKLVKYGKQIDGTYYVVEAAPDTASKKLQIISAYIQKTEGTPQAVDAKAPHPYVRNAHASVPSINPTLPQRAEGVNISIPGSGAENSRQPGLRSTNPDVQAMMDAQGRIQVARRTQRVFDRLGEKLGVNIVVDARGNGENGYYDSQTRTIHLNADSKDPLGQVFSHEITHRLKEASSADYLAFAQLAEEQLRRTGKYDSLASRIRDAYGELSPDALADEMVAHYAQNLVTNIDEFERLAGINRNLAQKLLDWLDEILHQARLSLQGLTTDEQDAIFRRYTFNEVADATKAWKEVLRRADAGAQGQGGVRSHIALNAETDVDRVIKGERLRTQVRLRDYTPAALVARGIPDLPMYMNAAHIRENILSEAEARAQGLPIRKEIHYHGLGKNLFLKAVDAMDGPIEVFQWKKNPYNNYGPNDYLVITQVTDQGGNRVIVPIVINSTANANNAYIDVNEIKSIYGRRSLDEYLARYTGNQSLSRIKRKKPQSANVGVQFAEIPQSGASSDPTVPQMKPGVNPHSMQEGKKYSRTLAPETRLWGRNELGKAAENSDVKNILQDREFLSYGLRVQDSDTETLGQINEYTNSKYTQKLRNANAGLYRQKMRMVNNLGEIVQNAYGTRNEGLKHPRNDNYQSFNHGTIDVRIGAQDYNVQVVTAIDGYNNEVFYDIVGIQPTKITEAAVQANSLYKDATPADPTVPQTEPGVNPHSMQEGKKYSRTLAPELAEEYGTIEPGEHPTNDVLLPRKDGSGSPVRRTYRTAAESQHADERMQAEIEQVIRDGAASYQVSGDREAADYAEATLSREGFDGARGRWNAALESGKTNKNDIVLGERLFKEAGSRGDYQAAREILGQVAAEATIAGQKVQAIRLIKRMGPAGELLTLEQTVRKIQKEIEPQAKKLQKKNDGEINRLEQETRKAKEEAGQAGDAQQKKAIEREIARMEKRMAELKGEITVPDEVVADIMSQKTQKGLDEAMTRAYAEIGKQVPPNWANKWNAWRFMAMLVNPTTHIRNITGNLFFRPAIALKDAIKIPMERALMPRYKGDPTAAFLTGSQTDKGYLAQGRESFEENRRMLMSSGKYNPSNEIRDNMRIFKNGVLEAGRRWNGGALEAEDLVFLRRSYERAYAQVLKANDYAAQDGARQAEIRKQAESWAAEEAWRATYRDASAIADAISRFSRMNAAANLVTEGLFPFKKTPINVAKRGLSYSPAGLVKGLYDMTYGVKSGKVDAAHAIDQFASGLSGTAIVALGAYLASQGLLNGAGDDDDKARAYRKQVSGYQQYSMQLGDKSYTIDWLAPSSMPLFVGAELWKLKQGEATSFKDLYEAMKTLPSPMVEMSMLSSLEDAIDAASYGRSGGEKLVNIFGDAVGSYFGQAVPTLGGKINRIVDGTQRNAYYKDKTAPVPSDWVVAYNSTIRQKTPGMSKGLEPKLDVWGREQKEGLGERIAENLVSPGYLSHNKETPVDKEILRLYEKTGESSVIPNTSPNKYFNAKGSLPRYDMSAAEYTAYMRVRGTTSYELINQMISSSAYKKMGDEEKAKMIGELYRYAGEIAKRRIAPKYADKGMDKAIEICTKANLTYGQYLTVRAQADTDGNHSVSQEEAKKAIDASGLSRKQKGAMWQSFNSKWKNNPYQ